MDIEKRHKYKKGTDTNVGSIEKDRTKKFIQLYKEVKAQSFIIEGIDKDFFFEFADCLIARIKELEEENKKLKAKIDVTNWQEKTAYESLKEKYIPVQKVKDKIEEINKEYEDSKDENGESPYYYPEYTIKVLEELLEEK